NELAAPGVVDDLLAEGLADSLHGTTVDLPACDRRVDDAADVVDGRIGDDTHVARLRVDLDFADVTGVRPGRAADAARRVEVDAGACLLAGEREEIDAEIGADDAEAPGPVFDVGPRRFERFGSQRPGVFDGPLGSGAHGRAANEKRART